MSTFKISLLSLFLLASTIIKAQPKQMTLGNVKMSFLGSPSPKNYLNNHWSKFVGNALKTDSSTIRLIPNTILQTYYADHLGLICKEELKLEKIIKFPVKIRLGSKDQVDYLEGKYKRY